MKTIAKMSTDTAVATSRPSRWPGLIVGLVVAGLLPIIVSRDASTPEFAASIQIITAIGCCLAILLGHFCYRRLALLPGIYSGSYVLMSMTATYALLAAVMLMLRLDYSRSQLTVSFVLAVAYFLGLHILVTSRRLVRIGVIPGGRTDALPEVPKVSWEQLHAVASPRFDVDGAVADLRADHPPETASYIARLALEGVPVYHVTEIVEQITGRVEIAHLSENTLGSLNPNNVYLRAKSVVDRMVALVLLVLSFPVMLLIGIAIQMESPGSAIFVQKRIGFRARPFRIFKFRTMLAKLPPDLNNGEQSHRLAITAENDPRITRVGRFLRRTRLDELPQLVNILLGDMSFIGPRPEAEQLANWYSAEIPFYHYRHIIKPGLTGWAQVNQGHVAEIEDIQVKLHLDFYYVKYFSFWLDVLITLKTIRIVFSGHGAK